MATPLSEVSVYCNLSLVGNNESLGSSNGCDVSHEATVCGVLEETSTASVTEFSVPSVVKTVESGEAVIGEVVLFDLVGESLTDVSVCVSEFVAWVNEACASCRMSKYVFRVLVGRCVVRVLCGLYS